MGVENTVGGEALGLRDLTALPTAEQVSDWIHRTGGHHVYMVEIRQVLAAVAALVRDTETNDAR